MSSNFDFISARSPYTFDLSGINAFNSSERTPVVVYGFDHCLFGDLVRYLRSTQVETFRGISSYYYSNFTEIKIKKTPSSNTINWKPKKLTIKRECKAMLVSLIFENWKRKKKGLPNIPLLFCVDIANNPYKLTSTLIAFNPNLRDPGEESYIKKIMSLLFNWYATPPGSITSAEIRRCYKLCHELEDVPEQRELSAIAKETLHFIRIKPSDSDPRHCLTEQVNAPWENEEWGEAWQQRKAYSQERKDAKNCQCEWKKELFALMAKEERHNDSPI